MKARLLLHNTRRWTTTRNLASDMPELLEELQGAPRYLFWPRRYVGGPHWQLRGSPKGPLEMDQEWTTDIE